MSVRSSSVRSTASRTSRTSSSHSVARREALIENATTQTALEYQQHMIEMADRYAENERQLAESERQMAETQAENERLMAEQRAESERQMLKIKAENDRQIAEKRAENERQRAANDRQMALLDASKAAAIAKAKLDAINQALREENEERSVLSEEDCNSVKRTENWISSNANTNEGITDEIVNNMPQDTYDENRVTVPDDPKETNSHCLKDGNDEMKRTNDDNILSHKCSDATGTSVGSFISPLSRESKEDVTPKKPFRNVNCNPFIPRNNHGFAGNEPTYQPHKPPTFETTPTELRLIESLARQSLPKYEPDLFMNDVTLYYTWKGSFQAMLQDAHVSPAQEIGFIRKYTSGESQKLVDSYRKRLYPDMADALRDIWSALDRKFGNTAAIAHAYLEQLNTLAKFKDTDCVKLQEFANMCQDVNSQLSHLPGLMSINYANVLHPIVCKLPNYLKTKWEKIVVDHANANENAYPTFDKFARLMSSQAELKNHPNIQLTRSTKQPKNGHNDEYRFDNTQNDFSDDMRVYATTSEPRNYHREDKSCPIHGRKGHNLTDCPTFEAYTVVQRRDTVYKAGLCYRCLVGQHRAADCHANSIKCSVCGSTRHSQLMHWHDNEHDTPTSSTNDTKRNTRSKDVTEKNAASTSKIETKHTTDHISSTCTVICDGKPGGTSCSKILLIDVFAEHSPHISRSIYALIDDQSNASLISSSLIDEMGLDGNQEKYLLTTCSGAKETRYGRRVNGLVAKSNNGTTIGLPSMMECDHIPQNKHEIATPHIAKQFPHLKDIVEEIPDLNNEAGIEILIGRDAPELLKVRAFRNGPSGAPWAQKLILGWTISGQVCLDRKDGPIHIVAHKTVVTDGEPDDAYTITPCPNYFDIKQNNEDNRQVFITCTDDDEIGLSNEDRRFLDLMDSKYHKNELGNCEMPLPFRDGCTHMPNNREQAMTRLRSLQRSFTRKPKVKDDYVEFMAKLFERGHAAVLSSKDEYPVEDGQFWYLPHFAVYHPKKTRANPCRLRLVIRVQRHLVE